MPPAQYVRDLRALVVLLQLADHRPADSPLPDSFTAALNRHLSTRRESRRNRAANDRTDRTWTTPPTDTRVLSALLHHAVAILDLPTPEDARDLLPPLIEAANEHEQRTWERVRSAGQPSDGLFRYFAPNRAGTFSVHMLRAACPTALTITSDHVPAYLDREHYQRWFASFWPSQQRNIRRAVPIAIVQLIEECDLHTAAGRLGIPSKSAQAAIIRAGRACKRTDRDDEFRRFVGLVAEDLQVSPIDYGHRRRYINADWDIPEPDWQRLVEQMLAARVARQDTFWEERRRSLRIWLWSHVTGGDPILAPMIKPTLDGRLSTASTIDAYTTLRRRAAPALEDIVNRYALQLTRRIDRTTPQQSAAVVGATAAR